MNAPLTIRSRRLGPVFDLLALHPDRVRVRTSRLGVAALATSALEGADVATLAGALTLLRGHRPRAGRAPFVVASCRSVPRMRPPRSSCPQRSVRRTAPGGIPGSSSASDSGATFEPEPVPRRSPHDVFTDVQLSEHPPSEDYREAVADARRGSATVPSARWCLARTVGVDAGRSLDPRRLAHRLRAVDPEAYTFVVPLSGGEAGPRRSFVGASPELLLSRRGREVRSNPLAGSAPRSGDPAEDRANARGAVRLLEGSGGARDRGRGRRRDAAAVLHELTWDPEPVLRETPNVWHLSTTVPGCVEGRGSVGARPRRCVASHPRGRGHAARRRPRHDLRSRTVRSRSVRGAGRMDGRATATASGRSRSAAPSSAAIARSSTRAPGSSPAPSPTTRSTRPSASSARSSTRSAGDDATASGREPSVRFHLDHQQLVGSRESTPCVERPGPLRRPHDHLGEPFLPAPGRDAIEHLAPRARCSGARGPRRRSSGTRSDRRASPGPAPDGPCAATSRPRDGRPAARPMRASPSTRAPAPRSRRSAPGRHRTTPRRLPSCSS